VQVSRTDSVATVGELESSFEMKCLVDKAHSGVDVNFAPRLRKNKAALLTKLGIGKNFGVNEKKNFTIR
jgi:hypothetical protein